MLNWNHLSFVYTNLYAHTTVIDLNFFEKRVSEYSLANVNVNNDKDDDKIDFESDF